MTPRFKFLITLKSLKQILIFFKLNSFLFSTNRFPSPLINHFSLFYKYFYFTQLFKIIQKTNLLLVGGYTNNLKKSVVYYSLKLLNSSLDRKTSAEVKVKQYEKLVFNQYFLSVKLTNFQINNKFYKNVFFSLLLSLPNLWHSYTFFLKYYLNFFFLNYNTQLFKFYNGHFFKVYNF